jgi:hypothetical protein
MINETWYKIAGTEQWLFTFLLHVMALRHADARQ